MQMVIPLNAWELDDLNPYCNTIKDAYDAQRVGDDDSSTASGVPTATTPREPTGGGVGPSAI
jgi:hypothetical protein